MARIAILWHVRMPRFRVSRYQIFQLGEIWEEQGHEVVHLFGIRRKPKPFDLCYLHVDLTHTPAEYAAYASKIAPLVMNAHVLDISKRHLDAAGTEGPMDGPVMLKTNLNCGGRSERWHGFSSGWRLWPRASRGYAVYSSRSEVPQALLGNPNWIAEPFFRDPQAPQDEFWTYSLTCSGGQSSTVQIRALEPEVKGANSLHIVPVEDDPVALELRSKWKLDYGKLDYIATSDGLRLIDVNKTSGRLPLTHGTSDQRSQVRARLIQRAKALDEVLEGRWVPFSNRDS